MDNYSIVKLYNFKGNEIGSILSKKDIKIKDFEKKQVIEEFLKNEVFEKIYKNKGILIYSSCENDTASIIVLNELIQL